MSFPSSLPAWVRGLARRFRSSLKGLVGAIPLTVASLSVRPEASGPLEVLVTYDLREGRTESAQELVIGEAGVRWLEENRRELVLEVRAGHVKSEFYHPFINAGLKRALVVPVFHASTLTGTVTVASDERDAYTERHLRLVRLLAGELSQYFPRPAPGPAPARTRAATRKKEPTPADGEALVETDALGRIERWDGAAEALFGFTRREVIGEFLALFYRERRRRLIEPTPLDELLAAGTFRGRLLCYDSDGLPLTCEVELARLNTTDAGVGGFRGSFRPVTSETLLPREAITFDLARLYAFTNPLARGTRGNHR